MPAAAWAAGVHAQGLAALGLGPRSVAGAGAQTPFPALTPQAAAATYTRGLALGGARAEARRTTSAGRAELACVGEFCAWLSALPLAWGRNAATAVPEDVVVFFETHWVAAHGRTYVGDATRPVASASGVKGALLHLEHYFTAIGRVGNWDPASLTGNPCRSAYVTNWRLGYRTEQWQAGVRPVAATPASDHQIGLMTRRLPSSPTTPADSAPRSRTRRPPDPRIVRAVRCRDDCLLYYVNEGGPRGGEVRLSFNSCFNFVTHLVWSPLGAQGARLRWCDLDPSPLEWAGQVPSAVLVMPNGHKTQRERHCGEFTITCDPTPDQPYASRFLRALPDLVESYSAAGLVLEPAGPVFAKTAGAGYRLTTQPATYGVLRGVLSRRAAEAGLSHENFTGHSGRRGRMQGDRAAGIPAAATRKRALGICTATYELYTDLNRPIRRRALAPSVASPEGCPSGASPGLASFFSRVSHRVARIFGTGAPCNNPV